MNDIRKADILYFTLFPWENEYSSVSLSFAKEFLKNNRVFYINPPITYREYWKWRDQPLIKERKADLLNGKIRYEKIPNLEGEVIAVQPPLNMSINFLPSGPIYRKLHAINHKRTLKAIKQVIEDYQLKNFIYFNCYNPFTAGVLPSDFGQLLNVYQCIDDMWEDGYTVKHGARLEEQVIAEADLTVVTSRELKRLKQPFNPNTHIIHNAVDLKIFDRARHETLPRPAELADVTEQVIVYTGNLSEVRIDYPLLRKIALGHPDKKLLIVGPLNSDDYKTVGLDTLENVILAGPKNIRELAGYLQHSAVAIIPFLCNKLTASIYPLKVNEYLATGIPIVAASFSEDIRSFSEVVEIADTHDDFIRLIGEAITSNTEEKARRRAEVAQSNTWKDRVEEFWQMIEQEMNTRNQR